MINHKCTQSNLQKLLGWLELDYHDYYSTPKKFEKQNTASVMQARTPINNKSLGCWKNYENLLNPALKIFQKNGVKVD